MKKIMSLSVALAAGVLFCNAQKISFGLKAGLNASFLSNMKSALKESTNQAGINKDISNSPYLQFNGGGYVNFKLGNRFSFQPELLYSVQGNRLMTKEDAKYNTPDPIYLKDADKNIVTQKLSYLNLPLMFQYNTPKGFYFEAGPQVSVLLSSRMKTTEKYDNSQLNLNRDNKDNIASTDFSLCAGAGYNFSKLPVGLSLRYFRGFTDVVKNNSTDKSFYNSVIQLNVLCRLSKMKK